MIHKPWMVSNVYIMQFDDLFLLPIKTAFFTLATLLMPLLENVFSQEFTFIFTACLHMMSKTFDICIQFFNTLSYADTHKCTGASGIFHLTLLSIPTSNLSSWYAIQSISMIQWIWSTELNPGCYDHCRGFRGPNFTISAYNASSIVHALTHRWRCY